MQRKNLLTALSVAAAGAFFFAPQSAAAQTATETIHACYVPASGTVYRIKTGDTKQECASKQHIQFSWNETGIGAQGPKGVDGKDGINGTNGVDGKDGVDGKEGPKGDKGDTGAGGVINWEFVTSQASVAGSAQTETTVTATCPAGKKVLGGGFSGGAQRATSVVSRPTANGNGWSVTFYNQSSVAAYTVEAFASCATGS